MASCAPDDPDAGRLLAPPLTTKRKRHQVRIQGRLVLVRSVSAVNLAPTSTTPTSTDIPPLPTVATRHDPGVGQVVTKRRRPQSSVPRRRSYGNKMGGDGDLFFEETGHDGAVDTADESTEEDEQETALRDRQRRGYGIGGAGNIRRPTEVVQFYTSSHMGLADRGRRRWQWVSSLFGLRGRKEGTSGRQEGTATRQTEDTATRFESS
ncbi:hypothetical protein Sste5346_009587 [Sporothrix stenoceras]|uniref:Uncharacterized protein n=1 Tax=Sporothrix stenoceras TaxID=5173 RepID=A0ABR3YK22_9PEZI